MAARTLLLKLHERGLITATTARGAPVMRGPEATPDLFDSPAPEPLVASLSSLRPLQFQWLDASSLTIGCSSGISANIIIWATEAPWGRHRLFGEELRGG